MERKRGSEEGTSALGRTLCGKNTGECSRNLEQDFRRRGGGAQWKVGGGCFEGRLKVLLSILFLKRSEKPFNNFNQVVGIIMFAF